MTRIEKAVAFGLAKHAGQVRKYTGEPYFEAHCVPVAEAVRAAGGDDNMYIAALLHDTIEDTDATYHEIQAEFGVDVANLVLELTDYFTPERFPVHNRAHRKKLEAERLGNVSDRAKTIKLEDLRNNTASIVQYAPGFAKVYLKEKAYLLECMGLPESLSKKKIPE